MLSTWCIHFVHLSTLHYSVYVAFEFLKVDIKEQDQSCAALPIMNEVLNYGIFKTQECGQLKL